MQAGCLDQTNPLNRIGVPPWQQQCKQLARQRLFDMQANEDAREVAGKFNVKLLCCLCQELTIK